MTDATLSVKLVGDAKGLTGSIVASKEALAKLRREVSGTSRALKRFGHYGFAYLSARQATRVLTLADSYRLLEKRIEAATRESGNYAVVSERIHEIARNNGQALASTVNLFQGINRVRTELGATDEQILRVTDALQKAGVIGGSSLAQMQAGMLQFSQAMASGVVRAEEMNSIVENMPEAAAAIAHGMGMTVGQLQAAVRKGEVLSTDVFGALLDQSDELQQRFEAFGGTLEQAGARMEQSLGEAFARVDQAIGATAWLKRLLNFTADQISVATGSASMHVMARELERLKALRNDGWHDPTGLAGLFGANRATLERRISKLEGEIRKRLMQQDMRYRMTSIEDEIAVTERRLARAKQVGSAVADSLRDKLARLKADLQSTWEQLVQKELGPPEPAGPSATPARRSQAGGQKVNQLARYLDGLREERATLGMSAEELARYRAAKLGAGEASQALAARLASEIASEKALDDALDAAIAQQNAMEKAYDARMKANDGVVASLEAELSLMKLSDRERAIEINLRKLSSDATEAQRQKVRELSGEIYDQEQAAKRAAKAQAELAEQNRRAMQRIETAVSSSMQSAEDAFVKFARTGKLEFGDLVNSMVEQMLRLAFQRSIAPGLDSLLTSVFTDVFKAFPSFGDGGVMTPYGPLPLERYGTGGVVNRPQLRIAGERYQPEAIVPLPDGRAIPVRMQNDRQGVVVNVIESPGHGGQVQRRDDGGQQVIDVFVEQVKQSVAVDLATGSGAVPRALESTYGLNRAAGAY